MNGIGDIGRRKLKETDGCGKVEEVCEKKLAGKSKHDNIYILLEESYLS